MRKKFKGILFGPGKSGKTTLAVSCLEVPEMDRPIFLNMEDGWSSIEDLINWPSDTANEPGRTIKQLGNPVPGKIDVVTASDWKDLERKVGELVNSPRFSAYNTLIGDGLDRGHFWTLQWAVKNLDNKRNDVVPSQADYGAARIRMLAMMDTLYRIQTHHVICTAGVREGEVHEGDDVYSKLVPNFFGQVAEESISVWDFVGYLSVRNMVVNGQPRARRVVQFSRSPSVACGQRSPIGRPLPELIVKPTMSKIADVLYNRTATQTNDNEHETENTNE